MAGEAEAGASGRSRLGRLLKVAFALYAVTLVASWVAMTRPRPEAPLPEGAAAITTRAFDDDGSPLDGRDDVRLAYRDSGRRDGPVILMLHGSPGSSRDFRQVGPRLEAEYRIVAPDLPGFGASTVDPPSVSVRAHAAQCLELMDELGIDAVHAVGFSMGGGVALEMSDLAPDRVKSITMMAALGVEELELLGTHALNHGLHQLQLALFRLARWTIPHFGRGGFFPRAIAYARNFRDTDQRRLRPILEGFEAPMLILHGEDDFLIPEEAAREHARIVPQAELVVFPSPAHHFLPWQQADEVARRLESFVGRVESNSAPGRSRATMERVAEASKPFDPASIPPFEGPALFAILVLLAISTFVSEDLACIAAGLLVADGRLGMVPASAACFVGIFVGDMGLYLLGRLFGRPALGRKPLSLFVTEAAVARASAWFDQKGLAVIFLSRFTPGLRLPTYVAAGVLRTSFLGFVTFFAIAGVLWTPALVGLSAILGERLEALLGGLGWKQLPWLVLFVVVMLQAYRLLPLAFTHRGRRILRGKWLRVVKWEFWPPWLAYLPVLPYVAWLAVKHRGLSKPTAANPAMPAGGFVGESKAEILAGLGVDAPEVARWAVLRAGDEPSERERVALAFVDSLDRPYPVFVKPDEGQRGSGVRRIGNEAELREHVATLEHDAIVQQAVDGPEFGVFYTRHPDEDTGSVFGVTIKELPTVTGDGERTLEQLWLDDPRACAMHRAYLREAGARASDVPANGEVVPLVRVGTHARGAVFLEGAHLITPELEAAIERIARPYDGFHFGRFDLIAPDPGALSRGEGLRVIELNGVTSEPTNIYDPSHSPLHAYRELYRLWARAYAIGSANAARGASTTTLFGILREWWRYRRAQRSHRTGEGLPRGASSERRASETAPGRPQGP